MTSTHAARRPSGSPGCVPAGRPLIHVLDDVLTAGRENGLNVISMSANESRVDVTTATEADTIRWARALGCSTARRRDEPDLGIAVTSADTQIDGYSVHIQHVHRAPTITSPGEPTE